MSEAENVKTRWCNALKQLAPRLDVNSNGTQPLEPLTVLAEQAGADSELQAQALAEILSLARETDLTNRQASRQFVERVPISFARKHCVLGLENPPNGTLSVAVSDMASLSKLDVISRYLNARVEPIVAPREAIVRAIDAAYQKRTGQAQAVIESMHKDEVLPLDRLQKKEDLLDVAGRAPVVTLINTILFEAVKENASDVHVQPYEDRVVVRFRIDGVLFNFFDIPRHRHDEVVSRIKVIGRMDIAERRLAQDGRSSVTLGDRAVDLRIASLPTSYGERVVIRILDKGARVYTLGELGMDAMTLERFRELITLEHGLVLVTGPTGSGKSTTLYASLQEINTLDGNVVTLEDPIEYQLEGISQTQINEKKGMTFATGLRHVLRQDPDIIMVGEIRDRETAVMAIQSALTGHMVFSTLHTNDAASAVTRLLDLGIEPYLVASSLVAVMAQRLVRRVCPQCRSPITISADELRRIGVDENELGDGADGKRGTGCESCRKTGYRGRLGLFELLVVDDGLRRLIQSRANASEIRDDAVGRGMQLLRRDGVRKVLAGSTTVQEVVRVTVRADL